MNEMILVETRTVNETSVNGYYQEEDAWFTRNEIGEALGYEDCEAAIRMIHNRHKERLDRYSRQVSIVTNAGLRDAIVYNWRGVYEICRWSKQPKADAVMDALYDMAESVRKKGYFTTIPDEELLDQLVRRTLDNPSLLDEMQIGRTKKRREGILLDERKEAFQIARNAKCEREALVTVYKQKTSSEGLREKLDEITQRALGDISVSCPHVDPLRYIGKVGR